MKAETTARILGLSSSTLRRAHQRAATGQELLRVRSRAASPVPRVLEDLTSELVRATAGQIGAEALRRTVPGISRRAAARVKEKVLACRRVSQRARHESIEVSMPGVVRGFDAMHVATREGRGYLLASCDGAIPYRTSLVLSGRYDGVSVARALEMDLAANGAPLVLRMDRASVHGVPDVWALLRQHGVLVLHGPARHPRFYGQLERQNREHRAMLRWLGDAPPVADVEAYLPEMKEVLNARWRRRALGWEVPEALWTRRPELREDREQLRKEVHDRAARIAARLGGGKAAEDLANRIGIEEALIERGYLRRPAETVLIGIRC